MSSPRPESSSLIILLLVLTGGAVLYFSILHRHGQAAPWMLFALLGWLFALFIGLFFWMLKAPDTQELPTSLPGRKRYRLGPEGTRRAAMVFGGMWVILTMPGVVHLFDPAHPLSWFVLGLPLLGIAGGWLLARAAQRARQEAPQIPRRELGRAVERWTPLVLVVMGAIMAIAFYPIIQAGHQLAQEGKGWGWLIIAWVVGAYAVALVAMKKVLERVGRELAKAEGHPPMPRQTPWLPLLLALGFITLVAGRLWQEKPPAQAERTPPPPQVQVSPREAAWQAWIAQIRSEPSPCPDLKAQVEEALAWGTTEDLEAALKRALQCKIQRPSYQKAKADRRWFLLDRGQPFPEEALIRRLRDRLIQARRPPAGTLVHPLPRLERPPVIDGLIEATWEKALALRVPGTATRILLAADEENLYLAADVADQTQASHWDSLRLILHEGLSPWLSELYVFVYGEGYPNSGCRISQVKWPEPPPPGGFPQEERWKAFRLNECGLLTGKVKGGSRLEGHRQYELALNRKAAGVLPGVPIPLRVEIEVASERRQRRYVGPLRPHGPWQVWVQVQR